MKCQARERAFYKNGIVEPGEIVEFDGTEPPPHFVPIDEKPADEKPVERRPVERRPARAE